MGLTVITNWDVQIHLDSTLIPTLILPWFRQGGRSRWAPWSCEEVWCTPDTPSTPTCSGFGEYFLFCYDFLDSIWTFAPSEICSKPGSIHFFDLVSTIIWGETWWNYLIWYFFLFYATEKVYQWSSEQLPPPLVRRNPPLTRGRVKVGGYQLMYRFLWGNCAAGEKKMRFWKSK